MRPPGEQTTAAAGAPESEATGLPGLRSWRAGYIFVLGVFVVWVALLVALTAAFS